MTHEYLFCSMAGSYWVPCLLIGMNKVGEATIRYFDYFVDGVVEATVEPSYVRPAQTTATDGLIPQRTE